MTLQWMETGVTDQAGSPSEIEIQTNESPSVYTRSFITSTDQDVLTTTASNAEVVLTRNWKQIRGGRDWVTPLGALLTISLGLLTTNFVPMFGASAEFWKALFTVGAAGSALWLVGALVWLWQRGPALEPREVVALLMTPPPGLVGDGNPAKTQTRGAGSQDKAPLSVAEQGAAEDRVSTSLPSSSLGAPGRWCPPKPAAVQGRARGSGAPITPDSTTSGDAAPKLSPGVRVRHPNFGVGTVLDVRPGPTHMFVEVRFDDADVRTKKLREDLAPLRPAGEEK